MPQNASVPAHFNDADRVIDHWKARPGALLPVLHGVQKALGYIPADVIPRIAEGLNLSRAEVHGVVSFYHDFRTEPPAEHTVRVCRAEACQSVGAINLELWVQKRLGAKDHHGRSADGQVAMQPVYCLGNCALGPSMMFDDRIYGRVTPERFEEILAEHGAGGGKK
jgi:formate dehydrogenase subunit gamma